MYTQQSPEESLEQEAYQTIPDVFGSMDDIPQDSNPQTTASKRKLSSPSHNSLSSSVSNVSFLSTQSEFNKSGQFADDSVFTDVDCRPPLPPPTSSHHTSTSIMPSPHKNKRALRTTCSVGDVQSSRSPLATPLQERPLYPVPSSSQNPRQTLHSHNTDSDLHAGATEVRS